jgi:hypothetical protein
MLPGSDPAADLTTGGMVASGYTVRAESPASRIVGSRWPDPRRVRLPATELDGLPVLAPVLGVELRRRGADRDCHRRHRRLCHGGLALRAARQGRALRGLAEAPSPCWPNPAGRQCRTDAVELVRRAAAVLKLYRPGFGGHRTEAAALRSLDGIAPRLLDVVDRDGRTGLVLDRFDGTDMLTLLQHQPWRVLGLAGVLATAHRAVHRVAAPAELPDLRQVLADRIHDAGLPAHLRDFAMRVLDGLPDGDRLCHGDYHPGNVLLAADQTAVIDWAGAARGAAEADHARTLLLLQWADPLPGTPLLSRALIGAGRSLLAYRYVGTYRRSAPPLRQVPSWLLVHAAARLSEGIQVEHAMLIGMLERAQRKATR